MDSVRLDVVDRGPFRFVRHPNYAAVFLEMVALPLVHTAWMTALAGAGAHVWVLSRRVFIEESVLFSHAAYRATMAQKPRFLPTVQARSRPAAPVDRPRLTF